jgi:HNH endonuclease
MSNEVLSYLEMCRREGVSLQRGMNFGVGGSHSVILMSVRPNAPYEDELLEGGTVIIYEGHDTPRTLSSPYPKQVDQPEFTPSGTPTENGKFFRAAVEAKNASRAPERVRVYEKLRQGIWSYNGTFHLVDAWRQPSKGRQVFKFKLVAIQGEEDLSKPARRDAPRRRVIPTEIKLAVWKRDGGKCVACGARDDLHFDHIVPYSLGGTSVVVDNIQLLCARHNIAKRDRIQ